MKKTGFLFAVLAVVAALPSFADFRPGFERPIYKATLETRHLNYPRAELLTMTKQDGARFATGFTLVEDTGIRCVTTPCPSSHTSQWRIDPRTGRKVLPGGTVVYTAVERVRHPSIAARVLTLTDHSRSKLEIPYKHLWLVKIEGPRGQFLSWGNPEGVITTASVGQ